MVTTHINKISQAVSHWPSSCQLAASGGIQEVAGHLPGTSLLALPRKERVRMTNLGSERTVLFLSPKETRTRKKQ